MLIFLTDRELRNQLDSSILLFCFLALIYFLFYKVMAPPVLPALPPSLKGIQHYLKIATDYESRDPPIAYWGKFLIHVEINSIAADFCSLDFYYVIL